jgi:hypothetical protein
MIFVSRHHRAQSSRDARNGHGVQHRRSFGLTATVLEYHDHHSLGSGPIDGAESFATVVAAARGGYQGLDVICVGPHPRVRQSGRSTSMARGDTFR